MNKAFTLLELIVVIVIVGVLSVAMLQTDFISFQNTDSTIIEKDFRSLQFNLQLNAIAATRQQVNFTTLTLADNGIGSSVGPLNQENLPAVCPEENQTTDLTQNLNRSYFCGQDIQRFWVNDNGEKVLLNQTEKLSFAFRSGSQKDCVLKKGNDEIMLASFSVAGAEIWLNSLACKIDLLTPSTDAGQNAAQ